MSNLPNNENKKIQVFSNEYITTTSVNRPLLRLLANDLYLEENTLTIVEVPTSSTADGSPGQVAHDDTYLYIYSSSIGGGWKRIALDGTAF